MARSQTAYRYLELTLLVVIIIVVWILMFLPVLVYFLPPSSNDPQSDLSQNLTSALNLDISIMITTDIRLHQPEPEYNGATDNATLTCPKDFSDLTNEGECKPLCSSWMTYSQSLETANYVIVGLTTVIGILTTAVIIVLSFVHFKNMLEFPSVLILYQDIIVSIHGINVLIGFMDRRLFCTSENLVETYMSSASPYCTLSGFVSSYMVLSLTLWIAIQISYTFLAVYTPVYFKRLNKQKWKKHVLHLVSFLAGIVALLFPSLVTLGVGGYSALDTKFPPVVCFASNRDVTAYMLLIPLGIMIAIVITELILIFHRLVRNRCGKKKSKGMKEAEVKVIVICCCYVVLGLGAALAYAISSTSLRGLRVELLEYFECERTASLDPESQSCDRGEFERFTNPFSKILGYCLIALYPVITLIYFARKKKQPHPKRTLTHNSISNKSLTLTGI